MAGINGLGRRGIVGLEGLKCRGGWASIKTRLSLFGLCSRRHGPRGGSGRRRSAFCLWFLWFVLLVCVRAFGLWLLLVCAFVLCLCFLLFCACAFSLWLLLLCAGLWLLLHCAGLG